MSPDPSGPHDHGLRDPHGSLLGGEGLEVEALALREALVEALRLEDLGGGSGLAESGQPLEGSFSAVSKPIFASKYAFFRIFRDRQDHTSL